MSPMTYWDLISKFASAGSVVETRNACDATQMAVMKVRKTKILEDRFLLPISITISRLPMIMAVMRINMPKNVISI